MGNDGRGVVGASRETRAVVGSSSGVSACTGWWHRAAGMNASFGIVKPPVECRRRVCRRFSLPLQSLRLVRSDSRNSRMVESARGVPSDLAAVGDGVSVNR